MAGILQFALGLNLADFAGNAKKAEEFLEHLTKSAKGGGGVFAELAEKMSKVFASIKGASTSAGAGGFLGIAGAMGSALVAVAAMKGIFLEISHLGHEIAEKFIEAAEHGAQLYYKAARTQSNPGTIFRLEESAKAVGLSEAAPEMMMLRLQRALSGVSEMGERTDNTFAALGLNMREMRKLAPEQQLLEMAEALARVNAETRAGYASNIFGRYGYGDILQIVNQRDQLDKFREELGQQGGADLFARTSQAFASARATWVGLKSDMEVFFGGIAAGMVIPFQEVLEALRAFPWKETGELIGLALTPFVQAVRSLANVAELLTNPGHLLRRKIAEGASAFEDTQNAPAGERTKALLWNSFAQALRSQGIPFPSYGSTKVGEGNPDAQSAPPYYAPRANPFEKMGFIFNGRSDTAVDYARRTAMATERIAEVITSKKEFHLGDYADVVNLP